MQGVEIEEVQGKLRLEALELRDLDLTAARLDDLLIFRSRIINCRFDDATCTGLRVWASDFERCSFVGSDLREAAIGGWLENRGNVFRFVDFSKADLRVTEAGDAAFFDCDFSNARIERVDFGSSRFVRCRFAGRLEEVIFWDRGFRNKGTEANSMEDVDLENAYLRDVEFRRLILDRVRPPRHPDHLVLRRYRCVLERALGLMGPDKRMPALQAVLTHCLKWAVAGDHVGILNVRDLVTDAQDREFAMTLLRRAERDCGVPSE